MAAAEAERLQRKRIADVRAARERRNVVREARKARAQSIAGGVASGAGAGSSGPAGGAGSVTSQLGANLSFLDTIRDAETSIGIFQSQGLRARQAGQKASARGQLGSTIFGSGGLAERLSKQ